MIISYHATIKNDWARFKVINDLELHKIGYHIVGSTIMVEKANATVNYVGDVLVAFDKVKNHIDEYGFVMTPEHEHDALL